MKDQRPERALTIRTSEQNWFAELAKAYRNRDPIVIVDDSNVGIDPSRQTLVVMGLRSKLSPREWFAVSISVGMGLFGAATIVLAFADPDPTSKLGLMIASGAALAFSGGHTAIRILTKLKPPKVLLSQHGIEIEWD